jgi:hypothetical protein
MMRLEIGLKPNANSETTPTNTSGSVRVEARDSPKL